MSKNGRPWMMAASLLYVALSAAPATAAAHHGSGPSFRDCPAFCPEMVVVPPGTYMMGSAADDPHQGTGGEEQPQHRVNIRYRFAVGKFEITRDQYALFARETHVSDPDGCHVHQPPLWPKALGLNWHTTPFHQTRRDPVVCVSWDEARAYTRWLSQKTGYPYRLLSEAEWEYVARAGTTTEAFWGDDERRACEYANGVDLTLVARYPAAKWDNVNPCHDAYVNTAPVGSFKPNGFGLYDTAGNVFEWTADCLVKNYAGAPTDGSPRTDGDCSKRVNRGGSWTSNPTGLRSAHRGWDDSGTRVVDLGFRVARDLAYEPGQTFRDCPKVCPQLVVVPPGTFLMGSPDNDPHQGVDGIERPRHRVTIAHAFAVGKLEVTRDEYARFALETRLPDPGDCNVHEPPRWVAKAGLSWHATPFRQTGRDPVVCVSWQEARAYTRWLSSRTGHSYRLLSEAEWEYAARAGTATEAFWGDDEKRACAYGNGVDLTLLEQFPSAKWQSPAPANPNPGHVLPCHDGHVFTAAVGSYQPNAFGLYDTAGNVFEWVADCWSPNYDGASADGSPRTDGDCTLRVNRGGSWTSNPTGLRSAYRWRDPAWLHVVDLGFRVARQL